MTVSQEKLERAGLMGRNMAKEALDNVRAQLFEMDEPFSAEEKHVFWAAFEHEVENG